jgi:catechol 2,3-dioxygenase-like lactoylglutathione lyase family enzyme
MPGWLAAVLTFSASGSRRSRLSSTTGSGGRSLPQLRLVADRLDVVAVLVAHVSTVKRMAFIDHLAIPVRDMTASTRFYEAALAPFGIETAEVDGGFGFGPPGSVDFFVTEGEPAAPLHIAFAAPDRATVDAFHAAALAAGGRDNGTPGFRPRYHANYYGGYVFDPDGHNVEAVCHHPEG